MVVKIKERCRKCRNNPGRIRHCDVNACNNDAVDSRDGDFGSFYFCEEHRRIFLKSLQKLVESIRKVRLILERQLRRQGMKHKMYLQGLDMYD